MEDDLADAYDVVVLGSGMPESILAAAITRIGKSVLHLDRNEYYGGEWASFNFDGLQKWADDNEDKIIQPQDPNAFDSFLEKDEKSLPLLDNFQAISNVKKQIFVKENLPGIVEETVHATEVDVNCLETTVAAGQENISDEKKENDPIEGSSRPDKPISKPKLKNEQFLEDIKRSSRKFNLDLSPKVLFSQGSLVNLLISSNIARYAEFKCVTRVLTYLNGKLEQVPCSRADVFSTRDVTIVEKRMLMKLLTFCMDYEQHPEEYKDFENKTFSEFLRARKLTPNVQHYVLHAIAMVSKECSTIEGLKSVQRFLKSLGRYGNTPFLWPLYGSGELPQCFCRLCAVFGGVYYLKRSIDSIILNADEKLTAIISRGKKIKCQWLVVESSYVSELCIKQRKETNVSRAIFITDKSILEHEKEQITLLRLPASGALKSSVNVIELCPSSMACPPGLYVVHLTCKQVSTAEDDFKFALEILFDSTRCGDGKTESKKPRILWSAYFNRALTEPESVQKHCPSGVIVTGGPGCDWEFDHSVSEAKNLFTQMFPEEEFLPRAPDPEEIVLDEPVINNPGPVFEVAGDAEIENSSAQRDSIDKELENRLGNLDIAGKSNLEFEVPSIEHNTPVELVIEFK